MAFRVLSRRGFVSVAAASGAALLTPSTRAEARASASPSLKGALRDLADWVQGKGGRLAASILDLDQGTVVAEHDAGRLLNPASNQKLLTAAAALAELGGAYRYHTGVYGDLEGSTLRGLVLRGHGDPSLDVQDLERLTRVLVAQGLTRVEGPLLVDQSRFDERYVPPAFDQQPDEWAGFRAPVSALAVSQNTVTLNVLPTKAGKPARVWLHPPGAALERGSIATAARGRGQAIGFSLVGGGARLEARLGGHVAEGLGRLRFVRRLDDPRLVPGHVFRQLLGERGVAVGEQVRLGGESEQRRVAFVTSAPLAQLLHRVGKNSDNFYAEMILKSLGGEASGEPAASQSGAERVFAWLRAVDAPLDGVRIGNGSGLFDANRVSAALLTHALRAALRDPRLGADYLAQLAVGGVDGTLRSRFRRHPHRVRAKTGTLNDVTALSGYALSSDGRPHAAFSVIVEGLSGHHGPSRQKIDQIVERLL